MESQTISDSPLMPWRAVMSRRVIPLTLALLLGVLAIRIVGPRVMDASQPVDLSQLTGTALRVGAICWLCFVMGLIADRIGRWLDQPVAGPLVALGFRTGGVAFAAVLGTVWQPAAELRGYLLCLATLYTFAVATDTYCWAKELGSKNPKQDKPNR